jgi:hypothetical protein
LTSESGDGVDAETETAYDRRALERATDALSKQSGISR